MLRAKIAQTSILFYRTPWDGKFRESQHNSHSGRGWKISKPIRKYADFIAINAKIKWQCYQGIRSTIEVWPNNNFFHLLWWFAKYN